MDFAEPCPLVRPGLPLFGFCSSGRSFASALLSDGASRRPPLRLASPLSHRTWAEDLHLPAIKHARHTRICGRQERAHRSLATPQSGFAQAPTRLIAVSFSEEPKAQNSSRFSGQLPTDSAEEGENSSPGANPAEKGGHERVVQHFP